MSLAEKLGGVTLKRKHDLDAPKGVAGRNSDNTFIKKVLDWAPDTPLEETLGALDLIVKQGKALYAGVSNYRGAFFSEAVETVKRHDWTPITIHQPCYNMADRWVEGDLLGERPGRSKCRLS